MATNLTPSVSGSLTEQVAEEIRALLARRRIRQSQLARALGVSEQWVSVRLMGKQEIGLNELERIAAFFEIDYSELQPQREGRVVTHAGAPRRQTTVPKVGLPQRPHTFGPANRNTPTTSTRRPVRIAAAAA